MVGVGQRRFARRPRHSRFDSRQQTADSSRYYSAGAAEALIAKITLGMHPRLLLIDSQLLEVPSQRTRTAAAVQAAVILVQRAAGDPGCADLAISAKQC